MRVLGLLFLFVFVFSGVTHAAEQNSEKKPKKTYCQKAKDFEPSIHVYVDLQPIEFDFSKSESYLTENRKEALEAWQSKQEDAVWASADLVSKGVARGGVGVETSTHFIAKPYDKYGVYYCPYIQTLEIRFYYKTTILIASEHKKGTCEFEATMGHEMKHHDANVESVNEVVDQFKKDLPEMISYLERRYVKKEEVGSKFGTMKQSVHDAFEIYADVIVKEMQKKNEPIDTVQEYSRVSELCL